MASAAPAIANHAFNRDSRSGERAPSSRTPARAPAKTNPAHGKKQKFDSPRSGRMYASIGSGSPATSGVARTIGVRREIAVAEIANAASRGPESRNARQSAPAATTEGPITLRMSTLSSELGGPQPRSHA